MFYLCQDIGTLHVGFVGIIEAPTYLCHHDDLVPIAALLEPLTDDGFRLAAYMAFYPMRIVVGRVYGIKSQIHKSIQNRKRPGLVQCPPKYVASKNQRNYFQIIFAQFSFVE